MLARHPGPSEDTVLAARLILLLVPPVPAGDVVVVESEKMVDSVAAVLKSYFCCKWKLFKFFGVLV